MDHNEINGTEAEVEVNTLAEDSLTEDDLLNEITGGHLTMMEHLTESKQVSVIYVEGR